MKRARCASGSRRRGRRGAGLTAALGTLLPLLLGALPLLAQRHPVSAPTDTFADPAVRALVARARAARDRDIQGIQSYEGTLREHLYVGLTAFRFRRERGLFEQERVARIRWSADGDRAIQWLGARQAIPIIGADTRRNDAAVRAYVVTGNGDPGRKAAGDTARNQVTARVTVGQAGAKSSSDMQRELTRELLRDPSIPDFAFDPSGERLDFGGDWALNPLSDSASAAYRYASGDTLRISLPGNEPAVVLYEVKVEPRRADFHLVAGSLWFDARTASLVRATYKPARAFDLSLDEPKDARDVPGILKPVQADISYITVEYSLQDLEYWLPRRFALQGEVRMGRVLRMPLTAEWTVGDYAVNDTATQIHVNGPLPPGWARQQDTVRDSRGERHPVTVVVPPPQKLLHSPSLSSSFGARAPTAFTDAELNQLKGQLQALLPTYHRFRPTFAWGLQRGLIRYNRVEGLSGGGAVTVPFTPLTSLDVEARMGTAEQDPDVTATLRHGTDNHQWRLAGYHRLDAMGDWGTPFSITSSLGNLVLGTDRQQYYRATGASLGYLGLGRQVRWEATAFHELQRPVSRETTFFLLKALRHDTVDAVLPARPLSLTGVRGTLSWFSGIDPSKLIVTARLIGEAAMGDATYQRAALSLSATHPLFFGLAGALEAGAGALWGDEPIQRDFFLGGSATLRGFDANELHGASFWRGRVALAAGPPAVRIGVFSDVGWVGPGRAFSLADPKVSVGIGASFLDGLFRVDVSHAVRGGRKYKLNLYLDGLF